MTAPVFNPGKTYASSGRTSFSTCSVTTIIPALSVSFSSPSRGVRYSSKKIFLGTFPAFKHGKGFSSSSHTSFATRSLSTFLPALSVSSSGPSRSVHLSSKEIVQVTAQAYKPGISNSTSDRILLSTSSVKTFLPASSVSSSNTSQSVRLSSNETVPVTAQEFKPGRSYTTAERTLLSPSSLISFLPAPPVSSSSLSESVRPSSKNIVSARTPAFKPGKSYARSVSTSFSARAVMTLLPSFLFYVKIIFIWLHQVFFSARDLSVVLFQMNHISSIVLFSVQPCLIAFIKCHILLTIYSVVELWPSLHDLHSVWKI